MAQLRPKMAKMGPKMAKTRPKMAKLRSKMAKMRPKMTKMRPKMAKDRTGTFSSEEDAQKTPPCMHTFTKNSFGEGAGGRGMPP